MAKTVITKDQAAALKQYMSDADSADLIGAYLFFVQNKLQLSPVLFVRDKMIFQSSDDAIKALEAKGELWHETEIKIGYHPLSVNDQTKKIYICPFTGKVFGDNTHPNPQDAIYDWVSKCPENTERAGGLRVKRFFVSEDPAVINNYKDKTPPKEPITKTVYSSGLSGKLFGAKKSVIDDFRKNYLRAMTLGEVQGQNKFQIEENFLALIQKQLVEEKVADFVEALAEYPEFHPYIAQWVEE